MDNSDSTAQVANPPHPLRARNTAVIIGAVAAVAATVFQFGYFDCNQPFGSTLTGVVAVAGIVAAPLLFMRPGVVGKFLAVGSLAAAGVALFLNFATHICS